ncbi:hypothetical protein BC008_03320 [Mastigocoleus testarum BC008]|uniref:Mechanosensitive ion channel protein MscS n=2 Tax=Mastigocoleus TaxID=996924 RepID=A0A0V7ZY39_9CYAN|nr:hypothetical protein BC008_03320 [Mastigocoleus testarum BC008]
MDRAIDMFNQLLGSINRQIQYFSQQIFILGNSIQGFVLISFLVFALTLNTGSKAFGQIATPNILNNSSSSQGNIVYAPVTLDGRQLFHIAAREGTITNSTQDSISPLQVRVNMYEENISEILASPFNPRTLRVAVSRDEDRVIILVGDRRDRERTQTLMTVTDLDAQIHGVPIISLAQRFARIIRPALIQAQRERQPEFLQSQALVSGGIFSGIFVFTLILTTWYKNLLKKWRKLQEEKPREEVESASAEGETALDKEQKATQMMIYCEQKLAWQRKVNINNLKRWLLVITLFTGWVLSLAQIAGLFPFTRWLQDWLLTKPILLAIIVGTILIIKFSEVITDYLFKKIVDSHLHTSSTSPRQISRLTTFCNALKGAMNFIWMFIGVLWLLEKLNIPIFPILAGAGIIGFALSFSSQSLIRDVINGVIILLEDQFALGDIIDVGTTAGVVENMNLRMTQIRDPQGRLSTVPNNSISTVRNLTKDWSRIVFTVEIGLEEDIDRALAMIRSVACQMQHDEVWKVDVIDPVNLLGVNNISHHGTELVLWFKTQPGRQFAVAREFRRRLKYAFDKQNITVASPHQSVHLENSPVLRLVTAQGGTRKN